MSVETIVPWLRAFRDVDDVIVLHVDLTSHAKNERHALSWLDEGEKDRWRRYRFNRPKREFALCRAALRSVLCSRLDCDNRQLTFGASEHGKPFALVDGVATSASFNVSHSGGHGLIAFAWERRVGIDVEERVTRQDLDGIITTVFGEEERVQFATKSGHQKLHLFFTLWTLKEALIKALGTGFSLDPSRFQIPASMRHGTEMDMFRFPHLSTVEWKLRNLGNRDFAAAIALESAPVLGLKSDPVGMHLRRREGRSGKFMPKAIDVYS